MNPHRALNLYLPDIEEFWHNNKKSVSRSC